MNKSMMIRCITALLLLLSSKAWAGADVPVIKTLQGNSIAADSSVTVEDSKFFSSTYPLVTPYLVQNKISFKINEGAPYYLKGAFSASVTIRVTYTNSSGGSVTESDRTLSINYTTNQGGNYNNHAFYTFKGGYRVTVKVISKTTDVAWNVWQSLQVVNELQAFPRYQFYNSGDSLYLSSAAGVPANAAIDELPVSWANKVIADEYDLEWTYIDKSAIDSGLYGNPSALNADRLFENNATRVTVKGTQYNIPLLYDNNGYLYYRVRGAQLQTNGTRLETRWSSDYSNGLGKYTYNGHERKLNWQATTTYAEEGKRKTVIQYYDGSLRARQTVTKDNTVNRTVVAESLYDYQGRPVIQVLPAPTLKSVISYSHNFNRNLNGNAFDKSDYDTLPGVDLYCNYQTPAMDTSSGASKYYSDANPEKDSADYNRYIPHAGGFPYTEVEYTQDATGRINRQSGVGADFRLGSGHETKYFYGTPDQADLDALFGTEVGDASHYFKTMVRDANGQYSVSYTDMHGRTIATALAGSLPSATKMDSLSSRVERQVKEKLSTPENVVIKDLVMEHKKGLLVSKAGYHTFEYKLSPEALALEGCDKKQICYDCLYDLKITITDDCNNQKVDSTGQGKPYDTVVRNFQIGAIDTTCGITGFNVTFTKWLAEGSYEITKTLTVSRYGMDYYRDSVYLANNTCQTVDSFITEQKKLVAYQLSTCAPTCEACRASLGSYESYRSDFLTKAGIPSAEWGDYDSVVTAAYKQAVEDCDALCGKSSEDLDIRKAMLLDMTPPSGQYAMPNNNDDYFSIFHTDIDEENKPDTVAIFRKVTNYRNEKNEIDWVYDEAVGKLVQPQSLSPEAFSQKFKLSWAEALLPYHPEYCKLTKYEQLKTSYEWDRRFEAIDTYQEAREKGYLNPIGNNTNTLFSKFYTTNTDVDPLYSLLSNRFRKALEDSLSRVNNKYFDKKDGILVGYINLWGMATITVKCVDDKNTVQWYKYYNEHPFETELCEGDLDMAWRSFRQMYLEIKRGIVNKYINNESDCKGLITAAQLQAKGYQPHFSDAYESLALNNVNTTGNNAADIKNELNNNLDNYYDANCKAYVTQWWRQLAPCGYTSADSAVLIPMLIQVCKEGSDQEHIYGASSVKPSSTSQYRSFEEVINGYNATHKNVNRAFCNAYLITAPKPYDQQDGTNKQLWSAPDSCECGKISQLYAKYQLSGKTYTSFSQFLQKVYNTAIPDSSLTQLRNYCTAKQSGTSTCNYLPHPITLPTLFQCYTGDVCVSCTQVQDQYNAFKQLYPSSVPVLYASTDAERSNNTLFKNFMNYRLGFSKEATEYLSFLNKCNGVTASCESLQAAQDGFIATKTRKPNFFFSGNYGLYPNDERIPYSPEIIENGIARMPLRYVDSPVIGYSHLKYEWPRCYWDISNKKRFSVEVRIKMTYVSGQIVMFGVGSMVAYYRIDSTAAGYVTKIHSIVYPDGSAGGEATVETTSIGFNNWRVLKIKYDNGKYQYYIDDKMVAEYASTGKSVNISAVHVGYTPHKDFSLDWIKFYDENNVLKHVEDFLGTSAVDLPEEMVTECDPTNCKQSFASYFNQKNGTSYTYSQLDSLYYKTCGKLLSPCGIDSAANALLDFKNAFNNYYYNYDIHYDENGIDTTTWIATNGGTYNNTGVPNREVFRDGIAKFPDSLLSTAYPSNYVSYDYPAHDTANIERHFSMEWRLRAPAYHAGQSYSRIAFEIFVKNQLKNKFAIRFDLLHPGDSYIAYYDYDTVHNTSRTHSNVVEFAQDYSYWRTVKFEFIDSVFKYYLDGVLIKTLNFPAGIPLEKLTYFDLASRATANTATEVDWVKAYDKNNNLFYFEDFKDPTNYSHYASWIQASKQPCTDAARDYYNKKYSTSYTFAQIDSIFNSHHIPLDVCGSNNVAQLAQYLQDYKNQYLEPTAGYIDYDMTTLGGNVTPAEGPKGVFDVAGNLIGNTYDGTTTQVDTSFVRIWNSSTVNQAVGTLSLQPGRKFRLTLNTGQSAPCGGIVGMRYYQFDAFSKGYLNFLNTSVGSYIDFGDGYKAKINTGNLNSFPYNYEYVLPPTGVAGTTTIFRNDTLGYYGERAVWLGEDYPVYPLYYIYHYYPTTYYRVRYPVTVYHTDTLGHVGFVDMNPNNDSTQFANLRGYFPQHLICMRYNGTRDSTINRTSQIRNFNQINSITSLEFRVSDVSGATAPLLYNNFGSFANNHKLRRLRLETGYNLISSPTPAGVDSVAGKHWYENFPDFSNNFPDLRFIYCLGSWTTREADLWQFKFELPKLKYIEYAFVTSPAGLIDSFYNQLARVNNVDSGFALWYSSASTPPPASNPAKAHLLNHGWRILDEATNLNLFSKPGGHFYTVRKLPLVNPFVEFFNKQRGTNYTFDQIDSIYYAVGGHHISSCGTDTSGYYTSYCASGNCTGALTLCGRSEPLSRQVALDSITNCSDSTFFAVSKGIERYKVYKDSLYNRFDSSYRAKCLQAYKYETFTVTHVQSEYHYTLYYYDQAGNLLKTVPPAGVDESKLGWRENWSDSVKAKRAANEFLAPAHTLVTNYRYNTLNQVVAQQSPDGGATSFWYDRLGRLVVSQNAKQKAAGASDDANRQYSYTGYDELGRITEVGQVTNTSANGAMADTISRNASSLYNWMLNLSGKRDQVTRTVYDIAYTGFSGVGDQRLIVQQKNLRNRVSYTSYSDNGLGTYRQASFYSYDIHGNVDTLLQDYGLTSSVPNIMNTNNNRWKKIVYEYDLISGKVNLVQYQPGWRDRFYHKYSYDAENRLTLVETSFDSLVWEKDARYEYYRHGPLARTVIGEQQVQGMDYAYTLQGWLKGVNSSAGTYAYDMGRDGNIGSPHQFTARDAYSFTLNYFGDEYKAINTAENPFPGYSGLLNTSFRPLYNGNISSMGTYIRMFEGMENKVSPYLFQNYKYDQLNRLTRMDVYPGFNTGTNTWNMTSDSIFRERISYDANGNILKYLRASNGAPALIDSLNYSYYAGTNRLRRVRDAVSANRLGSNDWEIIRDIDDQPVADNYVYDEIGNMIKDSSEGITSIKWTVYGKIAEINRTPPSGSFNKTTQIRYTYDAQGNRIGKIVSKSTTDVKDYTWYVRDAQGNLLTTYALSSNATIDTLLKNADLRIQERELYGSSRLGMYNYDESVDGGPADVNSFYIGQTYIRGWRQYELTNHLGNVLSTISDKKNAVALTTDTTLVGYFNPDIIFAQDYYPFGMVMRVQQATNGKNYRYGFNGQEMSNEVKDWGNIYSAEYWEYDARIGRRWNIDPEVKDNESPYLCFGNNPIFFSDVLGNTPGDPKPKQKDPKTVNLTASQTSAAISAALFSIHTNTKYNRAYFISSLTPENKKPLLGLDLYDDVPAKSLSSKYGIRPAQMVDFVNTYKNYYNNFATIGMWFDGSRTIEELYKAMDRVSPDKQYKLANDFINDFVAKNEKWQQLSQTGVTFGNILMLYGGQELNVGYGIKEPFKSAANAAINNKVSLVDALAKVGGSKAVSNFLGWGNKTTILKSAADFTKDQLIKAGYTKQVLTDIAIGLREAAKKTIKSTGSPNPASIVRAEQVEQIIKTHF